MTKAQRNKRLADIKGRMDDLANELDEVRSELEDHFDGRSEKWQEGEAGEAYHEGIDAVQQAYDDLDNVATALGDLIEA